MGDRDMIVGALGRLGEGGVLDHSSARLVASQWHDGQGSALYAFSSSGHVDRGALERETERGRTTCARHHSAGRALRN